MTVCEREGDQTAQGTEKNLKSSKTGHREGGVTVQDLTENVQFLKGTTNTSVSTGTLCVEAGMVQA